MFDFITLCDGYKLDHRRQYPTGTEYVYSNFTPRMSRVPGQDKVVFFGLQYFLQAYLMECAQQTFFDQPKHKVLAKYAAFTNSYVGPNQIGLDHISALHDLGHIPLVFYALPEGTEVPLRMPMFTFMNTHPDFFWVTNYIETMLSAVLWLPCTSATTGLRYRRILDRYAANTGDPDFVQWQGHDFSFRGMGGIEAAALSGAGHLLSFTGTDAIPAIELLQRYYDGEGLIGGSVPATEHSVMCAGGMTTELDTYTRLLNLYPTGVVSIVSDTWDLWHVIGNILPSLKTQIEQRDGKCVIRPDSGDPVLILCGDTSAPKDSLAYKGVVEALWDLFGGTVNEKGFKVLAPCIGAIYGDSITDERCETICRRLSEKQFASTNVVFGIGSYTYQYVTRDTNGFAVKATWAQINGVEHQLYKDPKTDDGMKKSARGLIAIVPMDGKLYMIDKNDVRSHAAIDNNLLQAVWSNGSFLRRQSLESVRKVLRKL